MSEFKKGCLPLNVTIDNVDWCGSKVSQNISVTIGNSTDVREDHFQNSPIDCCDHEDLCNKGSKDFMSYVILLIGTFLCSLKLFIH